MIRTFKCARGDSLGPEISFLRLLLKLINIFGIFLFIKKKKKRKKEKEKKKREKNEIGALLFA